MLPGAKNKTLSGEDVGRTHLFFSLFKIKCKILKHTLKINMKGQLRRLVSTKAEYFISFDKTRH